MWQSLNKSLVAVKKQLFSEIKINYIKLNCDLIKKLGINTMFPAVFYPAVLPSHVTVDVIQLEI